MRVLLGVTGSVAALLTPKLADALAEQGHEVQVAATRSGLYFFKREQLRVPVWQDADEWPATGFQLGDEVLHIELRRWAELVLIAPLSANTLAKLAYAQADNVLTCALRAWDPARPVVVAPAMNTFMWRHPATAGHLRRLHRWYPQLHVVAPVAKRLACGDIGIGAMAPIEDLCRAVAVASAGLGNSTA